MEGCVPLRKRNHSNCGEGFKRFEVCRGWWRGALAGGPAREGQNQRYHFANYVFTPVASLTIHEVPSAASPLLGASLDSPGGEKLLGLSYDENRQWQPIYGSTPVTPTGSWETGKKYHVVLTMENKIGSVYIDGEPLAGSGQSVGSDEITPDIFHFYIGSYNSGNMPTESHLTVKNVLLYNRQLNAQEIRTLFLSQDLIGTEEDKKGSSSRDDADDDDFAQSNSSSPFGSDASSVSVGGRNIVYVCALVLHLLVLVYF
ncbi:trans-sialidase, putative [Trypanosoma cruzi marinkellei]|uniref:Trans-sialidase, putative n=1 Tax=Trypanosoma cruzi marinkellei TaxID=85056 RepID=K2NHB9_TRYCR|nr:trans-sialidase, putative [Trypanosoma cruzi marinkellei]